MQFGQELGEKMENINILMGELNAKLGNNRVEYEDVLGAFGYEQIHLEGEILLHLCGRNGLAIGNSRLKKIESHLVTRYSWDEP